jgi:hypothetical protein
MHAADEPTSRRRCNSDAIRKRALFRRSAKERPPVSTASADNGAQATDDEAGTGIEATSPTDNQQHTSVLLDSPTPRKRRTSNISVYGKVPQMYLDLLAATSAENDNTVMSTIGDLPVFPNTYGAGQWS